MSFRGSPCLPVALDIHNIDQTRVIKLHNLRCDLEKKTKLRQDGLNQYDMNHHIRNIKFLIRFYEAGGIPPRPGTTRWVKDGRFVDTWGRRFPEPFFLDKHTPDHGIYRI